MEDKTREAAAITVALMLARMAGLRFERDPNAPVIPLRHYLHAQAASLLLVPAVATPCRDLLNEAVQAHDADALVIRAAGRDAADLSFGVVLRGQRLFRAAPLRLWLGAGAPAHLVPDDPADTSFALLRVGLRGCEVPPWDDERDRAAGLALGLAELTRVLEGR
ncbi:hypothetical protein [Sphingomonas bacterium]|uniref:hypothetical protein n=1 Tax=Sphingomonas bacterium TaxID=1895847 RepID=UPI0015759601|nr:hypothetical protein [Sphingomonas bacterium]